MAHAFYVQMGGIVVYDMSSGESSNSANLDPSRDGEPGDISVLLHDLEISPQSSVEQPDRDTPGSNRSKSVTQGKMINSLRKHMTLLPTAAIMALKCEGLI